MNSENGWLIICHRKIYGQVLKLQLHKRRTSATKLISILRRFIGRQYLSKKDYRLELAFFCLDSIDKAKERVRIRVENGGHFVPDQEIEERYRLGYKHLNENWKFFDAIHLFETSEYDRQPKHLLTIEQNDLIILEGFPKYLNKLIPNIASRVK